MSRIRIRAGALGFSTSRAIAHKTLAGKPTTLDTLRASFGTADLPDDVPPSQIAR